MATISSLLNSIVLAGALLLSGHAWGMDARCPDVQAGQKLKTVSVFDGPPEERADLVPDKSVKEGAGVRSEWSVAYIFKAGRRLFVECRYGGNLPPIVLTPDPSTTHCVFRLAANGNVTLVCLSKPSP